MGDSNDVVVGSQQRDAITTPMMPRSQSQEEATRRMPSFLSPKHCMKFGIWNVRTLNDPVKGPKLAKEMDRYKIDVLGVAESRYVGSDRIMIEDKHVLYSGREDGRHTHGVALFCSSFASKCMLSWEPINERLLIARFMGRSAKLSVVIRV